MQGQFGNGVVNKDVKESIDCFFYNQSTNKHIIEFFETLSMHVQDYVNKYNLILRIYNFNPTIVKFL